MAAMPSTEPLATTAAGARVFRRARPHDAVDLAYETFLAGARVDMQALAAQLDVSPATVYRWFGTRGELLERVCERLAEEFSREGRARAQGRGDERVVDWARVVMARSAGYEPVRGFVAREPQLALRLLLAREGAVHRVLARHVRELAREVRGATAPQPSDEHVDLIVKVGTGLVWSTFVIGEEPEVDTAVDAIRIILAASA
jgi:AcrR family transcriptional regulator